MPYTLRIPGNSEFRVLQNATCVCTGVTGLHCVRAYLTDLTPARYMMTLEEHTDIMLKSTSDRCPLSSKAACELDIEGERACCLLSLQCLLVGRREAIYA